MKGKRKAGLPRKEAIIAAAVELFAKKGFQVVSTAEVAKRAGVSEGIIFYHFQSKEGILIYLLTNVLEEFLADLARIIAESASGLAAIECYIDFHFSLIAKQPDLTLLLVRDFPASLSNGKSPQAKRVREQLAALRELISGCLRRGQEDGSIRDCPVQETTSILHSLLTGAMRVKLLGLEGDQDFFAEAKKFCRRSLAPGL